MFTGMLQDTRLKIFLNCLGCSLLCGTIAGIVSNSLPAVLILSGCTLLPISCGVIQCIEYIISPHTDDEIDPAELEETLLIEQETNTYFEVWAIGDIIEE